MSGEASHHLQSKTTKRHHPLNDYHQVIKKEITEAEWATACHDWLREEANGDFFYCRSYARKEILSCNCFQMFMVHPMAAKFVANYMSFYAQSDPYARNMIIWTMIRSFTNMSIGRRSQPSLRFKIPYMVALVGGQPGEVGDVEQQAREVAIRELEGTSVCISSILHILKIGRTKFKTIHTHAEKGLPPPVHHLKGRESNRRKILETKETLDELRVFFLDLMEYSEPRATRFIRDETGMSDREAGTVDLPSFMSKRSLYKKFCWQLGHKLKTDGKGKTTVSQREDEEFDGRSRPICGWSTFRRFWKDNFPNLVIRPPKRDVCGLCYTYMNAFKSYKNNHQTDSDSSSSSSSNSNDSSDGNESLAEDSSDGNENLAEDVVEDEDGLQSKLKRLASMDLETREDILLKSTVHVTDAKAQREYVSSLRGVAVLENAANLPHNERTYLYYFDYAQNVQCPQFGGEQPGETYYYSPLNVNVFGIVDSNTQTEKLVAYCYHEGEGGKGGDNVNTMLYDFLEKQNLLIGGGKHLVLVCDNCPGQNKNRMVIRFIVWLVEKGYFQTVSLLFLVVGHTKNPCDRLFNLLKAGYRNRNIYNVPDLIKILDENPLCSAVKAPKFLAWDQYFETIYRRPEGIKANHCFHVSKDMPIPLASTTLVMRRSKADEGASKCVPLLNKNISLEERELRLTKMPEEIKAPGIKLFKRVELFKKYRTFVPHEYRDDELYQPVKEEDMVAHKESQKQKRVAKRKRNSDDNQT